MKRILVDLSDEQASLLDQMLQETGLPEDIILNLAISEFYQNYTAWKRRFSFEKKGRRRGITGFSQGDLKFG